MEAKIFAKRVKKRGRGRNPVFIKILKAGYGLKDFAEAFGCEVPHVSLVVAGHRKSKELQEMIAAALGETVEALWPPSGRNKARAA